jgi:hypothetical protein
MRTAHMAPPPQPMGGSRAAAPNQISNTVFGRLLDQARRPGWRCTACGQLRGRRSNAGPPQLRAGRQAGRQAGGGPRLLWMRAGAGGGFPRSVRGGALLQGDCLTAAHVMWGPRQRVGAGGPGRCPDQYMRRSA